MPSASKTAGRTWSWSSSRGGALADHLAGAPRPPRDAAALVETLARAMHTAHEAGVVHRDLKPENVLLAADGTPKIADFGLAKRFDDDSGPTQTGAVLGTPSYMAPEQAAGQTKSVGPAADVYGLGAILYELLTGRPPFQATTSLEMLERVKGEDPVSPRRLRRETPRDLETICLKCLQKRPARRYRLGSGAGRCLRRFRAGEPIRCAALRRRANREVGSPATGCRRAVPHLPGERLRRRRDRPPIRADAAGAAAGGRPSGGFADAPAERCGRHCAGRPALAGPPEGV